MSKNYNRDPWKYIISYSAKDGYDISYIDVMMFLPSTYYPLPQIRIREFIDLVSKFAIHLVYYRRHIIFIRNIVILVLIKMLLLKTLIILINGSFSFMLVNKSEL